MAAAQGPVVPVLRRRRPRDRRGDRHPGDPCPPPGRRARGGGHGRSLPGGHAPALHRRPRQAAAGPRGGRPARRLVEPPGAALAAGVLLAAQLPGPDVRRRPDGRVPVEGRRMTFTPHPSDVDRNSLVLDPEPLGEGGQGVVSRVQGAAGFVYKEYLRQAGQVNGAALAELVDFAHRLTAGDQDGLLTQCAWPVARVVDGNRVTGFLMPEVPGDFYGPIGGKLKL